MIYVCEECGEELQSEDKCKRHEEVCKKEQSEQIAVMEVAYIYRTDCESSGLYMIGKQIIALSDAEYERVLKVKNEEEWGIYVYDGLDDLDLGAFSELFYERILQCGHCEDANIYYLMIGEECCDVNYDLDIRMKVSYNEENEFSVSVFKTTKMKYELIRDVECAEFSIRRNIQYA